MPCVSIIIPVYNSARFIEACSESLFRQTLEDIEYVFVDDHSSDDSIQVLYSVMEHYPERAMQVRIVNNETNVGQAESFRRGLFASTGECIVKCDSDDSIEPQMLEEMYGLMVRDDLDMVVCNIDLVYPDGSRNRFYGRFEGEDGITSLLSNRVPTSICNKLVRRDIVLNPEFEYPVKNMCEDLVYAVQYEMFSKKVGYINQSFYNYFRHPDSFTWNQNPAAIKMKYEHACLNVSLVESILRKNNLNERYDDAMTYQCLLVKTGLRNVLNQEGMYKIWKDTFKERNMKIIICRLIPFKQRGLYVLDYLHLRDVYKKIKNVFMKG